MINLVMNGAMISKGFDMDLVPAAYLYGSANSFLMGNMYQNNTFHIQTPPDQAMVLFSGRFTG